MVFIADMRHFLDETGDLPAHIPAPARAIASHMGAIVAAATGREGVFQLETPLPCRRRPGRKNCPGMAM